MVYGLLRALPGDHRFVDPVIRATRWRLANLTPASGRQNHTASPSASSALVSRTARVHRTPPHVRDDRDTPLLPRRDACMMPLIWGVRQCRAPAAEQRDGQFVHGAYAGIARRAVGADYAFGSHRSQALQRAYSPTSTHHHCEAFQCRPGTKSGLLRFARNDGGGADPDA